MAFSWMPLPLPRWLSPRLGLSESRAREMANSLWGRRGPTFAGLTQIVRVQEVVDRIAEEVEAEHGHGDGGPGKTDIHHATRMKRWALLTW